MTTATIGRDSISAAMDRVPTLRAIGAHARERLLDRQIACRSYSYEHGTDMPEILGWPWKGSRKS
jgi:phosphoketolase